MSVPHGIPAKEFIDWVNHYTLNDAKRCRILLAEVLIQMEILNNAYKKLQTSTKEE